MIDQHLIQSATEHAIQAIDNSTAVSPNFRLIENFLCSELELKLDNFIKTVDDSNWAPVPLQEKLPRRSINWIPDTVIEELHIVADNLTSRINQTFNTVDLKLQAIQLWQDSVGYYLPIHKDNPVIDVSLQVYLFDSPESVGTTIKLDTGTIDLPFKHNTGYLMFKESYEQRIPHGTTSVVPKGILRHSLYVTWSVYGKQAPDPYDIVGLI